jgi:hypothetical protein
MYEEVMMQIDGMGAGQPRRMSGEVRTDEARHGKAGLADAPASEASSRLSDDEVILNRAPRWAQGLVQQALQFHLQVNGKGYQAPKVEPVKEITPETLFDFQAVADNVLQFVTGRLGAARADGKSDEALADMMAQARKGVNMGFADARKQLGDKAIDNEDIKTGIDQSYKLIQDGLDQFEQQFFGQVSDVDRKAAEMANRQQGTLEIETKEGDKVMLRFNDSWQLKSQEQGNASQFSLKLSQNFSFSLEGDLGDGELAAIGDLVKGLDSLADSFFNGKLGQSLDPAQLPGLDDSQLVAYSLRLKQSSRFSQSYQGSSALQQSLAPLADYLPRLAGWQQQADALLPERQQQALTPTVLAARGDDASQGASFIDTNQRLLNAYRLLGTA